MDAFVKHFPRQVFGSGFLEAGRLDLPDGLYIIFAKMELECLDGAGIGLGLGAKITLKVGDALNSPKDDYDWLPAEPDCLPNRGTIVNLSLTTRVVQKAFDKEDEPFLGPAKLIGLASFSDALRISNISMIALAVDNLVPV